MRSLKKVRGIIVANSNCWTLGLLVFSLFLLAGDWKAGAWAGGITFFVVLSITLTAKSEQIARDRSKIRNNQDKYYRGGNHP